MRTKHAAVNPEIDLDQSGAGPPARCSHLDTFTRCRYEHVRDVVSSVGGGCVPGLCCHPRLLFGPVGTSKTGGDVFAHARYGTAPSEESLSLRSLPLNSAITLATALVALAAKDARGGGRQPASTSTGVPHAIPLRISPSHSPKAPSPAIPTCPIFVFSPLKTVKKKPRTGGSGASIKFLLGGTVIGRDSRYRADDTNSD